MSIRLEDVIAFSAGQNSTRLRSMDIPEEILLTAADMDSDLVSETQESTCMIYGAESDDTVYAGDVVVHLARGKASVVSEQSSGKVISASFVRCEFDKRKLDPWYLCYIINESGAVRISFSRNLQCSYISGARLSIATLKGIELELPPIRKQRELGRIYRKTLRAEYLMKQKAEDTKRYMLHSIYEIGGV